MSIRPMYRKCSRCRRSYSFNPSTGDLGLTCKYCGHLQVSPPTPFPLPEGRFPGWPKL